MLYGNCRFFTIDERIEVLTLGKLDLGRRGYDRSSGIWWHVGGSYSVNKLVTSSRVN